MAQIKTVTTTSGTNSIKFDAHYPYVWFKNIGSGDVYVSDNSQAQAGADDTALLKAGEIIRITAQTDTVYVVGATTVEIHAQGFADCPFKVRSKGGDGKIDRPFGLRFDFRESKATRLGAAMGKSAGKDFDVFNLFGGRRLCNLADDGTVNAWYGDARYTEDGSNGQVMVWQPKFYYKFVPVEIEEITDGEGYHIRVGEWWVNDKPHNGYTVHPAFIDENGNEIDGYFIGAYEACLYDDSEGEYRKYDTWDVSYDSTEDTYTINALNTYLADADNDKLSSIAGVKPASGEYSTRFTRPNVNKMATNRGDGWTGVNFKMVSAEQLLFVIEYATFNSQAALGNGVVSLASGRYNESVFTGSTSALGNSSGAAASTPRLISDGTYETNTTNDKVSVRYRGMENFFGNTWAYIHGVNIHGNGSQRGGIPYYCTDFNYEENKNSGNYVSTHITAANSGSYISAFGYSTSCDWAFIPTEGLGNSTKPVGDYIYVTPNLNNYRITQLGGHWYNGAVAGSFAWSWVNGVGTRYRIIGGRLAYIKAHTRYQNRLALNREEGIIDGTLTDKDNELS